MPESRLATALRACRGALIAAALFSGVANLLMLTGPLFMMQVYDRVLTSRSVPTLVVLTLLIVGLFGFLALIDLIRTRVLTRVGVAVDEAISGPVFERVTTLPLRARGGDGMTLIRDLDQVRQFLGGQGLVALFDLPWMPVYLAVVFLLSPWLGWAAVAGILVLVALTLLGEVLTKRPVREAGHAQAERNAFAEILILSPFRAC